MLVSSDDNYSQTVHVQRNCTHADVKWTTGMRKIFVKNSKI